MANIEQQLPAIIFIDDEADIRSAVSQLFKLEDLPCITTTNPGEVLSRINTTFNGIVITDMHLSLIHI